MNLCIPTLNRYDKLEECVRSALWGKTPPEKIYIIDNGGNLDAESFCTTFLETDIFIEKPGKNLGVSKSWNEFITTAKHPMIISNDDIVFGRYDISNFIKAYNTYPEYVFFKSKNIPAVNMFSCFLLRKQLVDTIGLFDEQFYPAYFEDNDYRYRMKLAGFDNMIMDVETEMRHATSSTLAAYNDVERQNHHLTFMANQNYYIRKWGGLPEKETYIKPFDARSRSDMEYQNEKEFKKLLKIFKKTKPFYILEIGSMFGDTLHEWIRHSPEDSRIVSIDLRLPQSDSRYKKQGDFHSVLVKEWADKYKKEVFLFPDDSHSQDTYDKIAKLFPNGIDFLFIDGDHSYEGCKKDYMMYSQLVNKNDITPSVIAFHDVVGLADCKRVWDEVKEHSFEHVLIDDGKEAGWGIGVMYV